MIPRESKRMYRTLRNGCAGAVTLAAVLTASGTAGAALVVYEGFTYTAGTQVPDTGGSALRGGTGLSTSLGWADIQADTNSKAYVVTGTGLSYNSLTVGGNALNWGNDNLGSFRNLATSISGTSGTTGTYYISYLLEMAATPTSTYAGATMGAFMGVSKNGTTPVFAVGGSYANTPVYTTVTPTANQAYLLVGKIELSGDSGFDKVSMWVNPVASVEANAGAAQAVNSGLFNINSISRIDVYQSSSYGITVDEFRIGTTWSDVTTGLPVPEPAVITLAGVALLGLSAGRRRRS